MYLLELKKGAIYKTCLTQSNNIVSALYLKKLPILIEYSTTCN